MWNFLAENSEQALLLLGEHVAIVFTGMLLAVAIGVPLGALALRVKSARGRIMSAANIAITIPSIALFGLMLPLLSYFDAGIGKTQAIVALILYSQLPIIRNTYTGLKGIDPSIIDAAKGMGLGRIETLVSIQMPLAMPSIMAGIRTAMVMGIGITTIAAYVGSGGIGVFIQTGISRTNMDMVLAGAFLASLLSIVTDILMALLQKVLTPEGVKIKRGMDG